MHFLACALALLSAFLPGPFAERPSDSGDQLELDASGHMSSDHFETAARPDAQFNSTESQETVLLQMKEALEEAAGKEADLRSALNHALESEAVLEERTLQLNGSAPVKAETAHMGSVGLPAHVSDWLSTGSLTDVSLYDEPPGPGSSGSARTSGSSSGSHFHTRSGGGAAPSHCAPGTKPNAQVRGCESMCYRLFLTRHPWGECEEVVMDAGNQRYHWIPAERRYWSYQKKKKAGPLLGIKSGGYSFDKIYDTLILNTIIWHVDGYIEGLRAYMTQTMASMDQNVYRGVISRILLGMDIRKAVDEGAARLESGTGEAGALSRLESVLHKAKNTESYTAMQAGIICMEIMCKELDAHMALMKATRLAEKASKQTSAKAVPPIAAKALYNLTKVLEQRANILSDERFKKDMDHSKDLQVELQTKMKDYFSSEVDKATNLIGQGDPEKGLRILDVVIKRTNDLSNPEFNYQLETAQEKKDDAVASLKDSYMQTVEDARAKLTDDSADLQASIRELKPKIAMMQELKILPQVCDDAKKVSDQLYGWDLLRSSLDQCAKALREDDGVTPKSSVPGSTKERLGRGLGRAIQASDGVLPSTFVDKIDEAKAYCNNELKDVGCPQPPKPAPSPGSRGEALRSAEPACLTSMLLLLLAVFWR